MEIVAVTDAIGAILDTIDGMRGTPYMADNTQVPSYMVSLPQINYDLTLGDLDVWIIPVWLFIGKASDRASRIEVAKYLERTGDTSIKALLEADETLDGTCDSAAVKRARPLVATVGGVELLAIEFTVEVFG